MKEPKFVPAWSPQVGSARFAIWTVAAQAITLRLGLIILQPFEILKHGAIPIGDGVCLRGEIATDPALGSGDHLLPFLHVFTNSGLIYHRRTTNVCKAGAEPCMVRFGISFGVFVITLDTFVECCAALLASSLRQQLCQLRNHGDIRVILPVLPQLIV